MHLRLISLQKSTSFSRPEYGVIYVAQEYPQWQHFTLIKLRELYNEVRQLKALSESGQLNPMSERWAAEPHV